MDDVEKAKKIKHKSKNCKINSKIKNNVSNKEIKEFMENQNKKRRIKEKLEFLKAKRENIKLKSQLEELGKVKAKLKDRTYYGVISTSTLSKLKEKPENPYQYSSKTSKEKDSKHNMSISNFDSSQNPYKDQNVSVNIKYKSQPNKYKRREKSLEELKECLQRQIDELKVSQNGSIKLKQSKEKIGKAKIVTRNHSHRSKKGKYTSQSPTSNPILVKEKSSKQLKSKSAANLHSKRNKKRKLKMKSDEILEAAKVIQKHWRNKTERGKEKVNEAIRDPIPETIPPQRPSDQGSCQSRRKLKHSFSFGMDMQAPAAHSSNVMFGCVKQSSQDINSARFVEGGRDIKYHGQMTEELLKNNAIKEDEDELEMFKVDINNEDKLIDEHLLVLKNSSQKHDQRREKAQ